MTRSEKIMRKYGNAFGRVKALVFVLSFVVLGFSIVMLVQLFRGKAAADGSASMLPAMLLILLAVVAVIVFLFLSALKKAKQNGPASPIGLFFGMLFVGVATNLIICRPFMKLMWAILSFCTFGLIGGNSTHSSSGGYAGRYIRQADQEEFYLYNDLGNYALLGCASKNATTVEVRPHGDGQCVVDNDGNLYYPL